jgi:hypothetical protein|tara:strand:- start:1764 stop:2000 length:237 start_codon:yes stop_codon:yes gene_type:complete
MEQAVLNNLEDFNQAKALIEEYNESLPKVVTHGGSKPSWPTPDLNKLYTAYFEETLIIYANGVVIEILDDNEIPYSIL